MKIIKARNHQQAKVAAKMSADVLKTGGLIVYPTDTAYGLGGNALDKNAVRKVYKIKNRPFSKPTHVVIRNWQMAEKLCMTNDHAKTLHDRFLPGPLTIILLKKTVVPDILTAGLSTIGIRIPDHPFTRALSSKVDFPYTTPSANKSGGETPYSVAKVKGELATDGVDLIVDAGKLEKRQASTIIDLSSSVVKVLREGPILRAQIEDVLKAKVL